MNATFDVHRKILLPAKCLGCCHLHCHQDCTHRPEEFMILEHQQPSVEPRAVISAVMFRFCVTREHFGSMINFV
jgi:hypothetical protein